MYKYTPDYSRITRRIIAELIIEFAMMVLLFFVYLYTYRYYEDVALAKDLTSVFIGCLIAHFIMSVFFSILSFRKKIKSIEVTDKDLVINGLSFEGRLGPSLDSEAAAAIMLVRFAERIVKE